MQNENRSEHLPPWKNLAFQVKGASERRIIIVGVHKQLRHDSGSLVSSALCASSLFIFPATSLSVDLLQHRQQPHISFLSTNLHSHPFVCGTVTSIPQQWSKAMLTKRRRASWGKLLLQAPTLMHMSQDARELAHSSIAAVPRCYWQRKH